MISHFFIDRPIFASVLSVVIVIVGTVALFLLPIAQYPDVAPPTIQVTATYPGANAKTVADTVASPIEQEVNGVERMLYMSSRCTNDGQMTLDVTFELGTNLDTAQVLVQNRVSVAMAKLPEEVKRIGVTTKKKSPSILLCVNVVSPNRTYDQLYLSNFATLQIKDDLARVKGVGDVSFLGPRDYSLRVWLDPLKMAAKDMTAEDVIKALQEQNVQVAAGRLGQPPVPADSGIRFQTPLNTQGRLQTEAEFEEIIVKRGTNGELVYLRDVALDKRFDDQGRVTRKGIEIGAKNYDVNSYLDGEPAVTMAIFQLPGSNALETAEAIRKRMIDISSRFPKDVAYFIHYDTTVFIEESVKSVQHTLIEAIILVFIVVLVFLQNWRATLIPMIAVPVSLVGALFAMSLLGFSLNNLSLFGLVLAIGIVVDDAIVVVENVERWMAEGLSPRDASRKAMDEVTGPVIAIALVLCAVFVPTAFMAGITGQFYRQFALTIAASTIISAFNSLTLSPALCAIMLKPHASKDHGHGHAEALPKLGIAIIAGFVMNHYLQNFLLEKLSLPHGHGHSAEFGTKEYFMTWGVHVGLFLAGGLIGWFVSRWVNQVLGLFFKGFNLAFDFAINVYGKIVAGLIRVLVIGLIVYVGLIALTYLGFRVVPVGFIPEQDKGYLVINVQLPDGASLERTDQLIKKVSQITRETEGVAHTLDMPGYSILLGTNVSNIGGMYVILKPFDERAKNPEVSAPAILRKLMAKISDIQDAQIVIFGAPPVEGLGSTGGFKLQIQDRRNAGLRELQGAVQNLSVQAIGHPQIRGAFSSFTVTQPQFYIDIDREKAKSQGVSLTSIHTTLQTFLGSTYVNDFFFENRNWQVNLQADAQYRLRIEDIDKFEVRNAQGQRVPLSTLVSIREDSGPAVVNHYNLYPSAELNGSPMPGVSSGQSIAIMNKLADENLPSTMGYEWTELTLQEILAGEDVLTKLAFPLAVVFVFLVLAAQYESLSLPVSILLIVPMCLLAAITGIWLMKMDNNIFTQIGLVVLIGLAAKNAILIVEFAKQLQDQGKNRFDATVEACKLRLRPILMTSFAFILGVVPLVLAKGAGAEMRFALGVAVFSGMLGVTIFGIFFTPLFYVFIRWLTGKS